MSVELGPIWRSTRRSRTFLLQVLEVAIGFVIVGNLAMTVRFYGQIASPPSGHREDDVLEVVSRVAAERLTADDHPPPGTLAERAEQRRRREVAALSAVAGVRVVAPVSATQVDDRWSVPSVFWTDAASSVAPSACPGVGRSATGEVVGWTVETAPALAGAVDLAFVEGAFFEDAFVEDAGLAPHEPGQQITSAVITRCLRDALFGGAPALGRTLRSNRFPAARIVGVVEDVRMRVPFLYHTEVTALFVAPPPDERVARYLVRVEPGQGKAVAAAIPAALGGGDPDHVVVAGLFAARRARSTGIGLGTVVVLAAVTAALGIVAILGNLAIAAFLVGERRRAIGVRRALGATRRQILRYLLVETLIPTQIGNLVGLIAVVVMVPAAQRRFSGLHLEPLDMLATALLLSLAGVAARLLPALRATRIPPSEAARSL